MEHILYIHSQIDHDECTPLTEANMIVVVIKGMFTLSILDEQMDEYPEGVCTMKQQPYIVLGSKDLSSRKEIPSLSNSLY